MAKNYELTQEEVNQAREMGSTMILALILKLALDVQNDRDLAADEIEQGALGLIAANRLTGIPKNKQAEFRRAAEDQAKKIVQMARNMKRYTGPAQIQ